MRFITGTYRGRISVWAVNGEKTVDLASKKADIGPDMAMLVGLSLSERTMLWESLDWTNAVPVQDLTPAKPIACPGKIICLGLNYAAHAKEGGHDLPDYPALFMRGPESLTASGSAMLRPVSSKKLDYEAELMVIIGKSGRHLSEARALEHVFGYTVFNDGSVRDYQSKTRQWTPGKNFDRTGAIGPVVVTTDELPEGASGLTIESRLNGKTMQNAKTSEMIFGVAQALALISEFATLRPGDHIAMGTPEGVGFARKPPVWMKPGDVIEAEIENIGICRNMVVDETEISNG